MPKPRSQARLLDQFDTVSAVASQCTTFFRQFLRDQFPHRRFTWVEPSAGKGNFLAFMPHHALALDVSPRHPAVLPADFLTWSPPPTSKPHAYVFLGNPPFGKNSSLALKFINHAGDFATLIGFVLPRTFEKASFQAKVRSDFQMLRQLPLPSLSFEHQGKQVSVPVVFQIWGRLPPGVTRPPLPRSPLSHPDFYFVSDPALADFAFQRIGAAAGLVSVQGLAKAKTSHYFIKAVAPNVMKSLQGINWDEIKHQTAGNPSISKLELVRAYGSLTSK